jgi:HAD superfamily hydrolase (TIGR01509 family)
MLARLFDLVIFDCDGVLVDSEPISNRVLAECLTEIGLPTTPEESMQTYMGHWWPEILELAQARLGRPLAEGFSEMFRERQMAALAAEIEPVAGATEALDRVESPACVASNGRPEKTRLTLERCGLLERFGGRVFSAYEVERGKPAPDLFLHAARSMGADPRRCAVVEDSVLGVQAARAAGMAAFAFHGHDYATPFGARELEAAGGQVFTAMSELPRLLAHDASAVE